MDMKFQFKDLQERYSQKCCNKREITAEKKWRIPLMETRTMKHALDVVIFH